MKIFLIGIGGAGNKAVISAIQSGIITKQDSLLLNTTLSDIDTEFSDLAIKFGSTVRGGCGKERPKARNYMLEGLQTDLQQLDSVISADTELVVIATSTEGGTGSGSSLILSKYIHDVLGKPVQIFAFNGFEEDSRGLKNTVEFFQEVDPEISIQCTSNKKFMKDTSNKLTAEKLSNQDFITRLRVLIGIDMIESNQNIDSTDLFKTSTQIGYTVCNRIDLPKIKNIEQYNKVVKDALDEDEALDTVKSVKRLAVIFNVAEDNRDNLDFYLTKFKDKFGQPFEVYTHVQYDKNEEYVGYIASGLDLPLDEVKEVYNRYMENVDKVNKKRDNFLDEAQELKTYQSDDMFNMNESTSKVSKNDFFKNAGMNSVNNNKKENFFNENGRRNEEVKDSNPNDENHRIKLVDRSGNGQL